MSSSLFNSLGRGMLPGQMGGQMMPGPMGGAMQMMQRFQQFKQSFNGDPKAELQRLLQSGQVTQQQLEQAQQQAQMLMQMGIFR